MPHFYVRHYSITYIFRRRTAAAVPYFRYCCTYETGHAHGEVRPLDPRIDSPPRRTPHRACRVSSLQHMHPALQCIQRYACNRILTRACPAWNSAAQHRPARDLTIAAPSSILGHTSSSCLSKNTAFSSVSAICYLDVRSAGRAATATRLAATPSIFLAAN